MRYTVYCLTGTNATCVVGICVVVKGLELSALLPRQSMPQVGSRVALRVVAYRLLAVACQQVFPNAVAVGICDAVLSEYVAVGVLFMC